MGSYITGSERRCPICKRKFIPTNEWVYKTKTVLYCSWHCLRAAQRAKEGTSQLLTDKQKTEILDRLRSQKSCRTIADEMGISIKTVQYIRRLLY